MALELKLPHIRLVDGMGGGGSVKTIEMAGRTYIPQLKGWETIVSHLAVALSVSLARVGCRNWRSPCRTPLLGDRSRKRPNDDRRPAL